MTTITPSFATHKIVDGRWVLKAPTSTIATTADTKGLLCPNGITMTPPSFLTHRIVDGRWVPKFPSATPTPTSTTATTTDAKGALCPEGYSRKQLLRDIEVAAGQALVRGYPTTRVAAARKGRLGNKEDNKDELYQLLQWYKGGY